MKKTIYRYIGVFIVILVFGFWSIPKIISNFQDPDLLVVGKAPQFKLINQNTDTITSSFYKDKVYLVEFFFASCPGICITMNSNMTKIQQKFLGNPNFGIASFSIDPKRDTPQRLLEYSKKYKGGPFWNFLTGRNGEVQNIANKGFNLYVAEVEQGGEDGFEHSGMIALIDQQGNIRCREDDNNNPIIYYDGLTDEGIRMLVEDIQKLL